MDAPAILLRVRTWTILILLIALASSAMPALAQAPSAPSGIGALPATSSANLTWSVVSGATSYNIYRSTTSGGEGTTPYLTGITTHAYTDTGLTDGQTYYYEVTAVNSSGESSKSTEASVSPNYYINCGGNSSVTVGSGLIYEADAEYSGGSPDNITHSISAGSPALYQAQRVGQTFTYTLPMNNGSYTLDLRFAEIEYSGSGQGVFSVAANGTTVLANEDIYADAGGEYIGVEHEYPVTVTDGTLTVTFTASTGNAAVAAISVLNPEAPAPPTHLTATAGNAQVSLAWTGNASATSYNIYRSTSTGTWIYLSGVTGTSYTDTAVTNGTTYYYQVTSVNSYGESTTSNEASATPLASITFSLSASPSSLTIQQGTNGSSTVTVTPANGFTGNVALSVSSAPTGITGSFSPASVSVNGSAATSSMTISIVRTLSPGNYSVTVQGVSGSVTQTTTIAITVTVGQPGSPTGLTAVAGNEQIALTWAAPTNGPITGYNVYRGTSPGGEGSSPIQTGITSTSYTDSGLTNGTTYYYTVTAVNSAGEGPQSNEASATPLPPPTAPTALIATPGNAQISLSWFPPATTVTDYNIYRGTSSGTETLYQPNVTTSTYTDNSVTNGTTYYYEVTALAGSQESPKSNESAATPENAPATPTALTAISGETGVLLTWQDVPGELYTIERSTTSNGPYTTIASSVSSNVFSDSDLENGTTYYYVIVANDQFGTSNTSLQCSATPVNANPFVQQGRSNSVATVVYSVGGSGTSWYIHATDGTVISSSTDPNGWNVSVAQGQTTATVNAPSSAPLGQNYLLCLANQGVDSMGYFDILPPSGGRQANPDGNPQIPRGQSGYVFLSGTDLPSGSNTWEIHNQQGSVLGSLAPGQPGNTNGWNVSFPSIPPPNDGDPPGSAPGSSGNYALSAYPVYAGTSTGYGIIGATIQDGGDAPADADWNLSYDQVPYWDILDPQGNIIDGDYTYHENWIYWVNAVVIYPGEANGVPVSNDFEISGGLIAGTKLARGYEVRTDAINRDTTSGSIINEYGASAKFDITMAPVLTAGQTANIQAWGEQWEGAETYVNGAQWVVIGPNNAGQYSSIPGSNPFGWVVSGSGNTVTVGVPQDWDADTGGNDQGWYTAEVVLSDGPGNMTTIVVGAFLIDGPSAGGTGFSPGSFIPPINEGPPGGVGDGGSIGGGLQIPVLVSVPTNALISNNQEVLCNLPRQISEADGSSARFDVIAGVAPAAPTDLVAEPDDSEVVLAWDNSPGATSYIIERSTTSGGPYSEIADVAQNSFIDTGVTNGTTYYYVVLATSSEGTSDPSNQASATPGVLPNVPTGLHAEAENAQVLLEWSAANGATGYDIQRSLVSGGPYTTIATNVPTTIYNDTGLSNGVTYYYVVNAVNSIGNSANSNEASAEPYAAYDYYSLTLDPSSITLAQGGSTTATVTATRAIGFTGGGIALGTSALPTGITCSFSPPSLYSGTNTSTLTVNVADTVPVGTYYLVITGNDSGITRACTWTLTVTQNSLAPPTGLTATGSNAQVALSWTASSGASGYNIYRSTTSGGPYTVIQSGVESTTYTDTGVTNGTTYYYVVTAVNGSVESGYSNQAAATPGGLPNPPADLTATPGNAEVWLSWNASADTIDYTIARSTTSGGPYTQIATTSGTTYTDTSVTNGTTYYYVAYAVNNSGTSGPSNEANATPSAAITGLHINSGGPAYTDNTYRHQAWIADQYYGAGNTYSTTNNITGTVDPTLYQTQRTGDFTYSLPVPNGSYMLSLYMAETQYTSAGQRLFSVTANGSPFLTNFDIYANAGADTALVKALPIIVTNGQVDLNFTGNAAIAAIGLDLIPSIGGNNRIGSLGGGPVQDVPAPGWAEDTIPSDSSDAPGDGPSGSEDVSLPAGVEENNPGADIWAFNPIGPSVSYERTYRSSVAAAGYSSPGLSPGWTDNYDFAVEIPNAGTAGPLAFYYPNGGMEEWSPVLDSNGNPTGQILPPAGAPYLITGVPANGNSGGNNSAAWQSLTVTWKDRTQFTFTPDPAGNTSLYRLSQITNLVGHYVTINRDTNDLLTSIVNDAGTTLLSFGYQNGQLQTISDNTLRSVTYGFTDLTSQNSSIPVLSTVSVINIPSITQWQYNYTVVNQEPFLNEVQTQDPGGSGTLVAASTQYDSDGRVQSHLDANSNTRSYTYTASDAQVVVQRSGGTQDLSYTQDFNSNNNNVDTGIVDAFGHHTSLAYADPQNTYQATTLTNRNGQQTQMSYDPYGSVLQSIDPRQVKTTSQLDYSSFGLGDVRSVQPINASSSLYGVEVNYYQQSDGVINGLVEDVFTAVPGENVQNTGVEGNVWTHYTYDTLGNVATVTRPGPYSAANGTTVTYNYGTSEALGEPLSVTTSDIGYDGTTTTTSESFRYDNRGNCTAAIDPMGYETDYAYNDADQCYQVTYPDPANGHIDSGSYTLNYGFAYTGGPVTSTTLKDGAGNTVRQVVYHLGHEGELQSVSGDVLPVSYTYDSLYRMLTQTDGKSQTTSYTYDAVGNLSSITYQGGDKEQYTSYDNDGNLLKRIDGNNVETDYTYSDPESLLTKIHYPGGQLPDVNFGYDAFGRRSTMSDGTGSQSYTWDDLGNMLTKVVNFAGGPQSVGIGYSYNPDGSVQHIALPAAIGLQYEYDGLGRMVQIAPSNFEFPDVYNYGYDADGRLTSAQTPASQTQYGYDALGEITSLTNSLPTYTGNTLTGWTPISSYTNITYDVAGNRLTETANVPGTPPDDGHAAPDASRALTYRYDNLNELQEEISVGNPIDGSYPYNDNYDEMFSYDAAGNATTFRGYSYPGTPFNSDNQLFISGFGYDGNGNPLSYAGNAFSFDPENRATDLSAAINGTTVNETAAYDGDGMRAEADGAYCLYDGGDPVCQLDSSGNLAYVNIFGPDGWRGRYLTESSPSPYYFTYDPQGNLVQSLTGVSDGSSTQYYVLGTSAYDGFGAYLGGYNNQGTIQVQGVAGFGGQWGYQTDPSTGYVFMTHRYYDPNTGRWINRDPIGTAGGINLYGFVGNNPITGVDSRGTSPGLWQRFFKGAADWLADQTKFQSGTPRLGQDNPSIDALRDVPGVNDTEEAREASSATTQALDEGQADMVESVGSTVASASVPEAADAEAVEEAANLVKYGSWAKPHTAVTGTRIVLGHFPRYLELGKEIGGNIFSIPEDVWNSLSDAEKWEKNRQFLDEAINRNAKIHLSTPPWKARPGSYYERELQYLEAHGYVVSRYGTMMIRK